MTGWKPIATAPTDGRDVLLHANGHVWVGAFQKREVLVNDERRSLTIGWSGGPFVVGAFNLDLRPTHWASIPPLPVTDAD